MAEETTYTVTPPLELDPAESRSYEVPFFEKCAIRWRPNEYYGLTEYSQPTFGNGFAYQVSVAGVSAGTEPRWPKTLAATVVDGSVTWVCVAGTNGLNAITSPSVVSDPTGLTVSSVSVSESHKILLTVAGGVAGQDFDLVFSFTLNGVARVARQRVQVRKR